MAETRTVTEQVEASAVERDGESVPCSLLSYECVDDVTLPAVDVSGTKFVAIRLAKGGLLFKYSDCAVPALASKHRWQRIRRMTSAEANLLNAAKKDCHNPHAKNPYVVGDIMVDVDSFRRFYDIVRDCVALATPHPGALQEGGWLQINNSVCPYVWRAGIRYVPRLIVTLAAEVSLDDDGEEARSGDTGRLCVVRVTPLEMAFLNDLCTKANQDFRFDADADLVSLVDVKLASDAVIFELPPTENPFQHCVYLGRMDAETVATARMVMKAAWERLHGSGKSPAREHMDLASGEADTESAVSDRVAALPSVADPMCGASRSRVASSDTRTAPLPNGTDSKSSDTNSVIVLSPGGTNEGRSDESCPTALPSRRPTAVDPEELSAGGGAKRPVEATRHTHHRPWDTRSVPSPTLDSSSRAFEQRRAPGLNKSRQPACPGVAPSECSRDDEPSCRAPPVSAPTTIGSRCSYVGLRTSEAAGTPAGKFASPSPDSGFASPLQSPAEKRTTLTEFPPVETGTTVHRQSSQMLAELLVDETSTREEQPPQASRTTLAEVLPVEAGVSFHRTSSVSLAELLQDETSMPQEQPPQEQSPQEQPPQEQPPQASSGHQFTPNFRQPPPYVPPSKPAPARNDAVAAALQLATKYPMLEAIVHDRHAGGLTCDTEVLRMLAWFVHIQQQLFVVLRHQRNIVQELRGYDAVLVAECDYVIRDMLTSLKFWLSRQHDLPPRMRAVLHHTLSCAVLQRPVQSHLNYLIGGLFVIEPSTAAENFTFLRNAVALAMVAQGAQQQQHPTAAYVVAERCKAHLMRRMSAWSTLKLPDNGVFNQDNPQSWCDALTRAYSQVYSFAASAAGKSVTGRDAASVSESEAQQPSQLLLQQSSPVLLMQRKLLQQQLIYQTSGHTSSTPQQQRPPMPVKQGVFGSRSPEWQQPQDVNAATHLSSVAAATTTRPANLAVDITSDARLVNDGASAAEAAAMALAAVASPTTRSTATPPEFDRAKRRMVCSPGTAATVATPGPFQEATANGDEYSSNVSRRKTPAAADGRLPLATPQQSQDVVGTTLAGARQMHAMYHEVAAAAASRLANDSAAVYFRLPPTSMPVLPAITRRGFGNEQWMLVSDAARAFFPHCTVDEFQLVLEEILHIDLMPASADDLSALDVARSATGQLSEALAASDVSSRLLLVSCRSLAEHSTQLREVLSPPA